MQTIPRKKVPVITFKIESYEYRVGADGKEAIIIINYNLEDGLQLRYAQIFDTTFASQIKALYESALREKFQLAESNFAYSGLLITSSFIDFKSFHTYPSK